jgi:hypothetical protein
MQTSFQRLIKRLIKRRRCSADLRTRMLDADPRWPLATLDIVL